MVIFTTRAQLYPKILKYCKNKKILEKLKTTEKYIDNIFEKIFYPVEKKHPNLATELQDIFHLYS